VARYEVIADELRSRILSGQYEADEPLPSQRDLAKQFGTAMMTVRQALDLLCQEGLLVVEHGLGTFVASVGVGHEMVSLASFTEEMNAHLIGLSTSVLGLDSPIENAKASEMLRLRSTTALSALTRLRSVGGLPVVYQQSFMSAKFHSVMREYDASRSLYILLRERSGFTPTSYREYVTACAIPVEAARALQVTPGCPTLLSHRVTFSATGVPFVYDQALMAAERIELVVEKKGTAYSAEYLPIAASILSSHALGHVAPVSANN
jgi:DNA-binding GntR family transcriptional regulator